MLALLLGVVMAAEPQAEISRTLDAFHEAAAKADEDTYFGLLTDDAVFIGTDATERWTKAAFETFAKPYFERDTAWTYTSVERHITLGPGGTVAWFDERLHNVKYGATRGSGVLVATDAGWRISQYVLSFPIPNEVAPAVVELKEAPAH
jgi:hypothetical protein